MDDDTRRWDGQGDDLRRRLRQVLASFDASPAEVAGLAMLLAGGIACLVLLAWWARPASAPAADRPPAVPTDAGTTVTVHVAGAVVAPGVLELPASARVVDAVEAAGGATVLADLGALNLARTLNDGERIEVPLRGPIGEGSSSEGVGGAFDAQGRLDLNRATAAELETLPGIGPVLAQRIVEHREANGPFASTGALRDVPGIGERSFQRLAELVVVP